MRATLDKYTQCAFVNADYDCRRPAQNRTLAFHGGRGRGGDGKTRGKPIVRSLHIMDRKCWPGQKQKKKEKHAEKMQPLYKNFIQLNFHKMLFAMSER